MALDDEKDLELEEDVDEGQSTMQEDDEPEVEEDVEETEELDEEPAEESETESETEAEPQSFISVKHHGKTVQLTEDEAIEAIQQGLYVKDKDAMPMLKWAEQEAARSGQTLAEYYESLQTKLDEAAAEELEVDEAIPKEIALELVKARKAEAAAKAEAERLKNEDANLKQLEAEIQEFAETFPDVDVTKLPDTVLLEKKAKPNMTLTDVYLRYERRINNETKKVVAAQSKAKQADTGSLKGAVATGKDYYDKINEAIDNI